MPSVFIKNYLDELCNIFADINPKDFEVFVAELNGAF